MTGQAETRRVVESYFAAWTAGQVDEAFALLADELQFVGPTASYPSAAEFRPALARFAAIARQARIAEFLVDGDRAAMLYDCELPPPAGLVRISSFFTVANGRIRRYETQFDATEFRRLQGDKGE